MTWVQHKHFIGDLDIADAVFIHQFVDLRDDRFRTPVAITVGRFFVSGELLVEINQQEVGAVEPEILIPKILQCAEK